MTDDVLIYVEDAAPQSPALQVTLRAAHQSSGGHLYVVPPETVAGAEGARVIRSTDELQAIQPQLSQTDTLFASAWFSRKQDDCRPGDGESWDAQDFDCP